MERITDCNAGDNVWIIERDEEGEACEISGYMFIAEVCGAVIVSPYIDDMETATETLLSLIEDTANGFDTSLQVFPARDCYLYHDAAEEALKGGGA